MRLDIACEQMLPNAIEEVWSQLTDAGAISNWLLATDEFRPGVGCRFRMERMSNAGWVDAEVLEMQAPRRMVWSWSVGDANPPSKVTFMLGREGEGTRLRLRHVGEFDAATAAIFRDEWPGRIKTLAEVIGRNKGNG